MKPYFEQADFDEDDLEIARGVWARFRKEDALSVRPGDPDLRPLHEKLESRVHCPLKFAYFALVDLLGDEHDLTVQANGARQAVARLIETVRPKPKPKK